VRHMTVEAAISDLKRHTLARLPGDVAKLIYLAGTRDYNTGKYYHEGLARIFTEKIAEQALQECHNEVFQDLTRASMEELLQQVELYVHSGCPETGQFIEFWDKIEPYRVAIPLASDAISMQLFNSNVKIALAILRRRVSSPRNDSQAALLRP